MIVKKYTCPKCGYSKFPTNDLNDNGRVVKIGGEWQCEVCGDTFPGNPKCANCGEKVPGSHWEEVDMQM